MVYSWGNGSKGQLGHDSLESMQKPCHVETLQSKSVVKWDVSFVILWLVLLSFSAKQTESDESWGGIFFTSRTLHLSILCVKGLLPCCLLQSMLWWWVQCVFKWQWYRSDVRWWFCRMSRTWWLAEHQSSKTHWGFAEVQMQYIAIDKIIPINQTENVAS